MPEEIKAAFVRAKEAARAVGLPERSFHQYRVAGKIPSYKIGRNRLFRIPEVIAAIEAHREGTIMEVLR